MEPDSPDPLPARNEADEARFVRSLDGAPVDDVVDAVVLAIEARRPTLAGRLFQLVDDRIDPEPGSALDRAARAARMLLFRKTTPDANSWSELDDAWADLRRDRITRAKQRQRDRIAGFDKRRSRFGRRKR